MTCIAAVKQADGTVKMASDRKVTWGGIKFAQRKIFQRGKFAYGVSGHCRVAEILERIFSEPPKQEGQDLLNYLSRDWVNAFRECLNSCGHKQVDRNVDNSESDLILVCDGRIFAVSENFCVIECDEYVALGSGKQIAMGAMYAMKSQTPNMKNVAMIAVEAAIENDHFCCGPIDELHIQ